MRRNPWRDVYDSPESVDPWENPPASPLYLDVEPTNICNLKCVFCVRKQMTRQLGHMGLGMFEEMCRQAKEMGVKGVRFLRWGEPLLNKDIVTFVQIAKGYGLLTHMTTNGLGLDRLTAFDLAEAGLDSINVSMQGLHEDEYAKLRGENHDRMMAGLMMICRARNEVDSKPFVTVSTTVTDETEEQVVKFRDYMKVLADEVCVGYTWFRRLKDQSGIHDLLARAQILPTRFKCQEVMIKLSIDHDGVMSPCCLDYNQQLSVGRFPQMSLREAWEHPVIKTIRTALTHKRQDLFVLCSTCELNYDFRGKDGE